MAKPEAGGGTAGLVLAGGGSQRFGTEKAVAAFRGRPMMAWSVAALAARCASVAVVAARGSRAEAVGGALDLVVLRDDPAHPKGPLAGVAAGLKWAAARGAGRLVTLPCDTPLVTAAQIGVLLDAAGMDGAWAVTDAGPQSLCAVWPTRLAAALADRLAGGDHPPVHDWLARIGARAVWFDDARVFRNINTRPDLLLPPRKTAHTGGKGAQDDDS
ncbi:MAG: molybdenum cofactor guanylyltransferase [Caulobacteraceae bacterium]